MARIFNSNHLLFAASALTLGTILLSAPNVAADTPAKPPSISQSEAPANVTLNDTGSGQLLLKTTTPGRYIRAPMVATNVEFDISGPIIRSKVSQVFENTSDSWVEGVYVFPLPENAAVDRLRMIIGGRLIEGQIKEKKQARQIYEQAKSEGKKASLVEQLRPNMFTASVANIGPGERVSIQIEYQDKVDIKSGQFAMRFPMVVAPRYSPPARTIDVASVNGTQLAILDPVLDRDLISPPLQNPNDEPLEYLRLPVSLKINLDAGFDLGAVTSPYHAINVTEIDEDSVTVTLSEGKVPANRDFLLKWDMKEVAASEAEMATPYSRLFTQIIGDDAYIMSMVTPPRLASGAELTDHKRESLFIIDTSGSMGGESIDQAKAALLMGLDRLEVGDSFNIIRFSSDFSSLNSASLAVTPRNIEHAKRWVRSLQAGGGTEMAPALAAAFAMSKASAKALQEDEARLTQILFITDGSIGNERELFAQIKDDLGQARLFPVGIGSAPNSYFMSRSAKFGRGSFVQIGKTSEVAARMGTLFAALESPVLTDVSLDLPKGAQLFPSRLPDIYQTDPIYSIAKIKASELPRHITLSGRLADQDWGLTQNVMQAEQATGLDVLWAREKIAELEESRFERGTSESIDKTILQTALDHHLVTRLTSLVAVDITPSRLEGEPVMRADVPTMLPEGWDFDVLTAQRARSAPAQIKANLSGAQFAASGPPSIAGDQAKSQGGQSLALPSTASPHQWLAMIGALFLMLSATLSRFDLSRLNKARR